MEAKSAAVGALLELTEEILSNAVPLGYACPSSIGPGFAPEINAAIFQYNLKNPKT